MTRKDYELIAASIKAARMNVALNPYTAVYAEQGVKETAEQIAYRLKVDNPRFDFDRFMETCGIHE